MTEVDVPTRTRLADEFQAFCPTFEQLIMPPGYRDSAFALIDAVFSMQARYEGARRVVANYASWAGQPATPGLPRDASEPDRHSIADLRRRLTDVSAEEAAEQIFDNRARHPRANRLKAQLVLDAADGLVEVGVHARGDVATLPIDPAYLDQKRAWTAVAGLGPVTFEYFRMLCGAESSKPDVIILGWLDATLGRPTTWQHALQLILALAEELSVCWGTAVSQRGVDHTIWRHQSGRGLDPNAPVGWNADVTRRPSAS